jgi:hypothetical protein
MRPFLVGQELLPASAEEPARADVVKAQQYIRAADVLTLWMSMPARGLAIED